MNQITGTIIAAGPNLSINGEQRCCFVIACLSRDIMNIAKNNLFNKPIYIQADRRTRPRPEPYAAFEHLNYPSARIGFVHTQPKRRFKCSDLTKS
jgi:hypothetical protein